MRCDEVRRRAGGWRCHCGAPRVCDESEQRACARRDLVGEKDLRPSSIADGGSCRPPLPLSLLSLSLSVSLSLSFLPLPRRVSSRLTLACPQSPPPAARRSHAPLRFQASCHLPRRANRLPLPRDTALSIERVVFLLLCCACVSPLRFLRSSSPPLCATASCPLSAAPPPLPSASLRSSRRLAQRTHHTPPLLPFCARELRRHLTHVPRPARYRVRASSEHRHLIRR